MNNSWNSFISSSPWGDILQFHQWGEVKSEEGWTYHFVGEEDSVRSMLLMKHVPGFGNYIYIPHGPVFQSISDLESQISDWKSKIVEFAKDHNAFVVEIDPKIGYLRDKLEELPEKDKDLRAKLEIVNKNIQKLSHFYDERILKIYEGAGFKHTSRNMQPIYKLLYSLELTDDELMSLMDKNTRYNIGYAERKGVEIKEYLPDDPEIENKLKSFYELMELTQERTEGYPIRPYKSFVKLFDSFKGTENISLFEASFEGEVIAMNISERTDHWASSFYAGSNRKHSKLKASYLLRWASVQRAREFGSKVYDFWGIIPNNDKHKGYSQNKLSYGGTRIDHVGLMQLPLNKMKTFVFNIAVPLRTKIAQIKRSLIY